MGERQSNLYRKVVSGSRWSVNHVDGSESKVLSSYMVLPVSSENFPRVALV